jgi:tryptophanyl-tRNA synthetase
MEVTACEAGYVSSYNPELYTLMDKSILGKDIVYLGTGSPEYDLKITPKELLKFTKAKVADVELKGVGRIKSRILSGITPSGDGTLHIGNYLGAVKQFIEFAKSYDCFLFVADLHALTTIQNSEQYQRNVENLVINELSLLGDLRNITFFRQSDVPEHTELQSILNNVTPLGLLKRAHAYKDKLQKDVMEDEINLGLFNYPILMAADILLYKPDFVPVGRDQKQHIEICRDIGLRLNKIYKKEVLKLPEPYIPEEVAVVMGTDGKRKMAKSLGNVISIFEDEKTIRKQVMDTYTDPTRIRVTDPGHVEGNMVFAYLDFFGEKGKVSQFKDLYKQGKISDMEVKEYLFQSLMEYFKEARVRYQELSGNPAKVKKILIDGAEKAREVAGKTMMEMREAIGLTNQYSFFKY